MTLTESLLPFPGPFWVKRCGLPNCRERYANWKIHVCLGDFVTSFRFPETSPQNFSVLPLDHAEPTSLLSQKTGGLPKNVRKRELALLQCHVLRNLKIPWLNSPSSTPPSRGLRGVKFGISITENSNNLFVPIFHTKNETPSTLE